MILCQKQNISLQAMVCILQCDTVSETKYFFASHGLYYSMILCQNQNISLHYSMILCQNQNISLHYSMILCEKQNISLQAMVCITVFFFFFFFYFFFFLDSVLRPFQAFSLISRRINR